MKKLPILRNDLEFVLFEQDELQYILLSDTYMYAAEPFVLHYEAFELLTYFSGEFTEEDLKSEISKISDQKNLADELLKLIYQLDEAGFMLSENFFKRKAEMDAAYEELPARPAICENKSYPADKAELIAFLENILSSDLKPEISKPAKGIIAPHIDLSLGDTVYKSYAMAYGEIDQTADVYVIMGTSHFDANDYFVATKKAYATPLGVTEIDIDLLEDLLKQAPKGLIVDDMAHRIEHSIEFHALFLQYLLQGKEYKILPFLCGGYLCEKEDDNSEEMRIINHFVETLKKTIESSGKKVFFIASADLSHIGRRFDDEFDAEMQINQMEKADRELLKVIKSKDAPDFIRSIKDNSNRWKVCGVAPIYSIMKLLPYSEKEILDYAYNFETDTQSAVSFTAVALY
ncbi:MAG: AmmeMemoRadiSam system protein B [bacterium]